MANVRVYADTNIFYYLGSGSLQPGDFLQPGEELWATPVSLLELLAGVRQSNWSGRVAAAQAILQHAVGIAADPERHLVALLRGEPPPRDQESWREVCKALAGAKNDADLQKGVADLAERVIRTVNAGLLEGTKASHYEDFADKMSRACDTWLPGYYEAFRMKAQPPKLGKGLRNRFRAAMRSAPFLASTVVFGLAGRYELVVGEKLDLGKEEVRGRAVSLFAPYALAYGGYIRELVTAGRKPDPNDWGDLELFLYLQPGNLISTAEQKWWTIAGFADLDHRVRKVPAPA